MNPRCSSCNHRTRCVPPDGPSPCNILLIGERPGYWEDNVFNRPFTGDSGRELNEHYLRLAGLDRDAVRITNTVRCRSFDTNRKPSKSEVESCGGHFIPAEVRETQPAVIVLMGGTACSMVAGSPIDLDTEHGIPIWVERCKYFGDWSGWVVPMYHPAAGMHQTTLMIPLLEDWKNFGDWLKGNWQFPRPVVDTKGIEMQRIEYPWQLEDAMRQRKYEYLPIDTESDESRPFSIQFSPRPDLGCMILAQDKQLIEDFDVFFEFEWQAKGCFHFALHDLEELERQYGIRSRGYVDTMIDAYHLGNLPQGLKALTYRLTGVRMTSYQDVVVPASKEALSDWLINAIALVSTSWQMERTKQLKTKLKIESIKHPAESVLRRILRFVGPDSDSESEYDPWQEPKKLGTEDEEIRLLGRDWLESLESQVGRMPRKSIIHAPLDKAILYGVSDAVYTGHCMVRLEERRKAQQKLWTIDDGDVDA